MRAATPDDAANIATVHASAWQAAYRALLPDASLDALSEPDSVIARTARWRTSLEGGARVAVASAPGSSDVLAFAAHGPSRDGDAAESTGEIMAIYCRPGSWGCGYGRAVHDAALAALTRDRAVTATLWVLTGNDRARAFYERQGWVVDPGAGSTRRDRVAGTDVDEVRYRRPLRL